MLKSKIPSILIGIIQSFEFIRAYLVIIYIERTPVLFRITRTMTYLSARKHRFYRGVNIQFLSAMFEENNISFRRFVLRENKRRGTVDNLLDQGKNIFIGRNLLTCWKRTMVYIEKLADGKMSTWWQGRHPNRYIVLPTGIRKQVEHCVLHINCSCMLVYCCMHIFQSKYVLLFILQLCYR